MIKGVASGSTQYKRRCCPHDSKDLSYDILNCRGFRQEMTKQSHFKNTSHISLGKTKEVNVLMRQTLTKQEMMESFHNIFHQKT